VGDDVASVVLIFSAGVGVCGVVRIASVEVVVEGVEG
jgi:hypothetical protein